MDSKDCSWRFLTASGVLTAKPCELIYAQSFPSATNSEVDIYNGENTGCPVVCKMFEAAKRSYPLAPCVPIYCAYGLYVDLLAYTTGVFVMWRER